MDKIFTRKTWQKTRDKIDLPKGASKVSIGKQLDKFHKAFDKQGLVAAQEEAMNTYVAFTQYEKEVGKKIADAKNKKGAGKLFSRYAKVDTKNFEMTMTTAKKALKDFIQEARNVEKNRDVLNREAELVIKAVGALVEHQPKLASDTPFSDQAWAKLETFANRTYKASLKMNKTLNKITAVIDVPQALFQGGPRIPLTLRELLKLITKKNQAHASKLLSELENVRGDLVVGMMNLVAQ